jgi:Protein of unknown function DUF262
MDFNSSEETISWFRDRYREGTLKIKPPYQRKPVWAARQKCSLVESILLKLPVPEIYVQQSTTPDGITTYAIVDGQQRVRTVLQFVGSESDPDQAEYNKFVLDKLPPLSPLANKSFADLSDDEKKAFYGYKFAVRYLNTAIDSELRDMFERLNRFLTPLKPQELRNARFTGPFVRFTLKLADLEYWAENRIVTATMIRRMGDVEFVSELVIGTLHGPQGGSAADIDSYYVQFEDYDDEFPGQTEAQKLFDGSLTTVRTLLPEINQTRWSNKTDFYSLFIAVASILRNRQTLRSSKVPAARKALLKLAEEVYERLADDHAKVPREATAYARAVEKGANDKARRAQRHTVVTGLLEPYFA